MPGIFDSPIFQLGLQLAAQQRGEAEAERRRAADEETRGTQFLLQTVSQDPTVNIDKISQINLPGLRFTPGAITASKELAKGRARAAQAQGAVTNASGLAGQAGRLSAGTAGAGGIQSTSPQAEQVAQNTLVRAVSSLLDSGLSPGQLEQASAATGQAFQRGRADETLSQQRESGQTRRRLERSEIDRTRQEAADRRAGARFTKADGRSFRSDFRRESQPFEIVQTNYSQILGLANRAARGDAVAQQRLIVALEKMSDPNSVVREGEFARTGEVVSILDRFKLLVQSVTGGRQTLTPEVIGQIVTDADIVFGSAREAQQFREEEFTNAVREFGGADVDVRRVVGRGFVDPNLEAKRGRVSIPQSRPQTRAPGSVNTSEDLFRAIEAERGGG